MDIADIQARIDSMPAALNAKGKREPSVYVSLNANSSTSLMLTWKRVAGDPPPRYGNGEHISHHIVGVDISTLIDKADAIIASLPSIEEARMTEFTNLLAQTIEMGNAHGIDVQFVNPLTEAMKRLSENALTHQGLGDAGIILPTTDAEVA